MDDLSPEQLLDHHRRTGEPLSEEEVEELVEAGLTCLDDWENRGGNLYWEWRTFPAEDGEED
jgi:hypothetical protein